MAGDIKLVIKGVYTEGITDETRNVYYFHVPTTIPTAADMTEWVVALAALIMPITTNRYKYYGFTVYQLVGGSWAEVYESAHNEFGLTSSSEFLPPAVAGVVTWAAGHIRSRARKFFAGMLESLNSDGTPSTAVLTALGLVGTFLLTDFTTGSGIVLHPVVWSKKYGILELLGAKIKQQWGVMRKREAGVGI